MAEKPSNPNAFPITRANISESYPGMTLRDWFAGQALAGWLASFGDETEHPAGEEANPHWAGGLAGASYRLADAMLKARETTDA